MKYSVGMLVTCILYYFAGPRLFDKLDHRKCSFLTGLITSLTDLLQAYHQERIGTSKTSLCVAVPTPRGKTFLLGGGVGTATRRLIKNKVYRLPCPRPDRFALRILLFRARRIFFRPRRKPVRRVVYLLFHTVYMMYTEMYNDI